MELDELKEMWSKAGKQQNNSTAEELQILLRKKSQSPIAKMKRNLLMELLFVIMIYPLIIIYIIMNFNGGMLALAILMAVLAIFYILYYVSKKKLLQQMECNTCEVKTNLTLQLKTLEKYVRLYMLAGTAIFPVTMIVVSVVLLFYSPQSQHYPSSLQSNEFLLKFAGILLAGTIIFTIPMYFINKWYVRKLYGQHIDRLKSIVEEMDEETEV